MAGSQFFALLDDITLLLDDVAVMSKVAAKKTAAVLGDDLALNAEQVSGVKANRELPVVYAVAKGALLNKAILIPVALLISAFVPWLLIPLLMVGGAYLCFEGVEKVLHFFMHRNDIQEHKNKLVAALKDPKIDLMAFEKTKIKGAIRTDFILSAEILVIALNSVADAPFSTQVIVMCIIGFGMTFVVYGLVAFLVRLDDFGLFFEQKKNQIAKIFGRFLLNLAPLVMRLLTVVGTLAMFFVGGDISMHGLESFGFEFLHHLKEDLHNSVHFLGSHLIINLSMSFVVGFIVGLFVLLGVTLFQKIKSVSTNSEHA
ncbi:DUF808 domain-containing protein [Marinicellulosiphila megalodicopiae]|uniref:DUF808 domain-containing protein n=1 Tax=Marinicellulosiphila megalodicopiae TaxID=2724896 RepID=UPI003BB1E570